jgi:hypothetical protein
VPDMQSLRRRIRELRQVVEQKRGLNIEVCDGEASLVPRFLPMALDRARVIRQLRGGPPLRYRSATRERESVRRCPQVRVSPRLSLVPPVAAENANRLLARGAGGAGEHQIALAVR